MGAIGMNSLIFFNVMKRIEEILGYKKTEKEERYNPLQSG